jgi:hypothetical protein
MLSENQEYISEGIDWTHIKFEDNQECLDLIEKVGPSLTQSESHAITHPTMSFSSLVMV